MRRAQTFLRRVGIEISFEREGRARIRTIVTSNAMSEQTSENTWARASASSASPAPGTKANTINDFPALQLRTVSGAADGSTNGIGHDHPSIVRSNSLKTNLPPDADGEDANSPPQSAQEKNCLERTDMNAVQALEAARAAGITIALDGDDLMLQASAQPPEDVLELLSHHKPGIVVLLRPDRSWTAEDWRALYDERAGIAEIDGGYRAVRRKRRPSSPVSSNGSAEIMTAPCLDGVWVGVVHKFPVTLWSRSGSSRAVMLGCMRSAGLPGTPGERPWRSLHWHPWG